MTPLVIVGAGGFGRELFDLVADVNAAAPTFTLLGYLDDGVPPTGLLDRIGATFLGDSTRLVDLAASYVIGIGSPEPRRRIDALAQQCGRQAAILRHPTATVGSDVLIGDGVVIAAGARVTSHIVLGRHVHVNLNCTVGHDSVVEDFVTLYGGVHLGGGCYIEDGATLGSGSVVLPQVRVGRGAIVGAGAIVAHDVQPDSTVMGPVARRTLRGPESQD